MRINPAQLQHNFLEAARDFADAELRIRQLAKSVSERNCPYYDRPDATVGLIGGRCKDVSECAACAAIHVAWHERARMRKVRGLARRRMLRWREKEVEQQ